MREAEILGENIQRYRGLKRLSQKELAAEIPMSKDHLSKIECGRKKTIGMKYLVSIARVLDVEFHVLFIEGPESIPLKLVISEVNFQVLKRLFEELIRKLDSLAKKE